MREVNLSDIEREYRDNATEYKSVIAGIKEALPLAEDKWVEAVATIVILDYHDMKKSLEDSDPPPIRDWAYYYAEKIASIPCDGSMF